MSDSSLYLMHYGTKGMVWGRRRWQNADGSLTPAGKEHYGKGMAGVRRKMRENRIRRLTKKSEKQEKWLNDPTVQAKLAKANAKNEKYFQRYSAYQKAQYKSDRAILFKDFKQKKAERAYRRMNRANSPRAQKFIQKYTQAEYRHALTESNRSKASRQYIKRYGQEYYDDIMK